MISDRIKIKDVIKAGLPVSVYVSWPEDLEGEYKSSVHDYSFKSRTVKLSMPSYKGRLVPLPKGARVHVKIIDKNALYAFQSTVIKSGKDEDGFPVTLIKMPEYVKRLQRRRFNRIPLTLEGRYRRKDGDDSKPFRTLDFSAGGMLMVVPEKLEVGELIYISLKLSEDLELSDQESKVVREAGVKAVDKRLYGVEFIDVDPSLEKRLVRFVMNKEIEYKKKGIIL